MTYKKLARGVWGILATPYDSSGSIDHGSLTRQVSLYQQIGAEGVVALGVFGEGAKLTSQEKRLVVETVVEAASGNLAVVVGLSQRSRYPVVEEAKLVAGAASGGLAGLMLQVQSDNPETLTAQIEAVSSASGTGIVLQDYPLVSGIRIEAAALAAAVSAASCVVAIKAESPPTTPAISALASLTDVPVFGGLGGVGLIDELSVGAAGAMTGFSYPEGLVATVRAWSEGGFQAARDAWSPWLPLAVFEAQAGISLAIRKEILHRRGLLTTPDTRDPRVKLSDELLRQASQHLSAIPEV